MHARSLQLVILVSAMLASGAAAAADPDFGRATADMRDLLAKLVAADTTNPPGHEAKAVAIGAAALKAARIPFDTFEFAPGRGNLVARVRGTDRGAKPVLLLAHVDVVGASSQPWTTPPHQVVEKDGYLEARGVGDDLGMASMELEVLRLLAARRPALKRDVVVAWTGDEESGGAGIRWLLAHQRSAIGDPLVVINEGGGIVLGDDGKPKLVALQLAEKEYQDYTLRAKGPTGHSSVPQAGNAIYRLARALSKLEAHPLPNRLLPVTREYLAARAKLEPPPLGPALAALAESKGELPADALAVVERKPELAALLHTTCVATELAGGTRANALPAEATANVNCRILPDESPDDVRRQLAAIIDDDGVEVVPVGEFGRAGASPLDGPGPRAIADVVHRFYPGLPIVPTLSLGATDSRFLRELDIPCYGFRTAPMKEEDARRAHGIDERVPLASEQPGLELMYALVVELASS